MSDAGKVGGKLLLKAICQQRSVAIGITILKWHWTDLEIFQVQKIFRPVCFYTTLENFTF